MQFFILMAFVVTCLGTAILGARLVLAGRRTRTAPELYYGLGLLLTGTSAAMKLTVFGILAAKPEYHVWGVVAACCSAGALVSLSAGIRVIFRPGTRWANLLVAVFACVACAGVTIVALTELSPTRSLLYRPLEVAMLINTVWGAIECWRHYAKMRKRLALGLAEPVATSQFALWGASFTLGGLASALYLFMPLVTGLTLLESPGLALSVQSLMVTMTLSSWLAFYPPAAYRRAIAQSAR